MEQKWGGRRGTMNEWVMNSVQWWMCIAYVEYLCLLGRSNLDINKNEFKKKVWKLEHLGNVGWNGLF